MMKPNFSFWLMAVLGLLWNVGGSMNYIMQTNPDDVAMMPELYQTIITNRPAWATGAFAIGMFGGVLGCVMLLLRNAWAVRVFAVSFAGIALTCLDVVARVGFEPSTLSSLLVGAALLCYALLMRRKGWLR